MKTIKEYIGESMNPKVEKFWNDAWDNSLDNISSSKDIYEFIEELDKYNSSVSKQIDKILVDRFKEMFKEKFLK